MKEAKLALKKSKRKDYYKILGVGQNANDDDIRKAYRKRAMMHHPGDHATDHNRTDWIRTNTNLSYQQDRFPNETDEVKREEEKKFKEVGEAYAVLSDAKKRQRYDNGFDLDDDGGYGGGGMHDIDPNVLFQAFFGGGGGGVRFPF